MDNYNYPLRICHSIAVILMKLLVNSLHSPATVCPTVYHTVCLLSENFFESLNFLISTVTPVTANRFDGADGTFRVIDAAQ